MVLKDGLFFLNGKPLLLYSGEIHYFRTPFNKWRAYLKRAKEANLNTVATYIPWRWHEYEEGKFDFTGKTRRERALLTFLEMAEDEGLHLFLRPGPICHGENINAGLPGWLLEKYPQICMKNQDGSSLGSSFISFLSPIYQKYVTKWYEKIMPIIAPHQISKGGNVVLVQLDNEISMINWVCKKSDYSDITKQMYQDFLKAKYKSVEKLNKIYKKSYKDFSDIELLLPMYDSQPGLDYWDWAFFWREYYSEYYGFLAGTARSLGIEVPLVANIPQFIDFDVYGRGICSPMTSSMFKRFPEKVDNLVMGGAYQMRRLDYENFHDVAVTTEVVKMFSAQNSPAICAELQTGIMVDKPVLYPSDVDLNIFSSCAHGLNGLNCYMFASGRNFPDMGEFGPYHDWQAPVDLNGKPRLHYEPIKKWGKVFKVFGTALASSKKEHDIAVGFYMPYYMTEYLKGNFVSKIEFQRDKFFFDGICRLLELGGYNFKIVNIQSDKLEDEKNLVVFCLDFMDAETQERLFGFVKNGGNLIIGPDLPLKDLSGESCRCLREKLKLNPNPGHDKFVRDNKDLMAVEGLISLFGHGEGTALFKTERGNIPAVFKKVYKGKVIAYGFGLTHKFNYHIDIMEVFLRRFNLRPRIHNSDREIKTVIRSSDGGRFLFVANYHQIDKKVTLSLAGSKFSFMLPARKCRILPLDFQLTGKVTIVKATGQVLEAIKSENSVWLKMETTPSAEEEISLKVNGLKYLKIDGKKIAPAVKRGHHIIRFVPENSISNIEIRLKNLI